MELSAQEFPYISLYGVTFINPPVYYRQQEEARNLVQDILHPALMDFALIKLEREYLHVPNLGMLVWNCSGTINVLLNQILLVTQKLNQPASICSCEITRIRYVVAIIKTMSIFPDIVPNLISLKVYQSLYKILQTSFNNINYKWLRISILNCILKTVSNNPHTLYHFYETNLISVLLSIIPNRERSIEGLSLLLIHSLLKNDIVFWNVMNVPEVYDHILRKLNQIVRKMRRRKTITILKSALNIFLRLTDHYRGYDAVRNCIPDDLCNNTFEPLTRRDPALGVQLSQLRSKLQLNS